MLYITKARKTMFISLGVVILARIFENSFANEISKHSHVKPKCGTFVPDMKINSAVLAINFKDKLANFVIVSQSSNCFECPLVEVCTVRNARDSIYLLMNTTHTTSMNILHENAPLCHSNVEFKFGERGNYSLQIGTYNNSCSIHTINSPVNSDLPVLYAFLILGSLLFSWNIGRIIFTSHSKEEDTQLIVENDLSPMENPILRRGRLLSLDIFRGITICLMIFVNYGGGMYFYFSHAAWNGLTVADIVFPWFMFIMGVSLTFSTESQLRKGTTKSAMALKIVKRFVILFAIGLFIVNHNFDVRRFRIPGVLQKIAVSYAVVAFMHCFLGKTAQQIRQHFSSSGRIMRYIGEFVIYYKQWLLMAFVTSLWLLLTFFLPVEGCPKGYVGPGGTSHNSLYENCTGGAAGVVDRFIFGQHRIYQHPTCRRLYNSAIAFDPEGALGTLMSILAVFMGLQAGNILLMNEKLSHIAVKMVSFSVICGIFAGGLCGFSQNNGFIPVNKNLWSLSFVLCVCSMAFLLLLILYTLVDVTKLWDGAPFNFVGMNSILLYIGHEVFEDYFPFSWKPAPQTHGSYLAMNIWAVFLWTLIAFVLHKKRYYLSV